MSNPPHTYKAQRLLEKKARANREAMIARGDFQLPTICGFTYKTRPTTAQKADRKWRPTEVTCDRNAGSGTDHIGRGYCDYHEWQITKESTSGASRNEVTRAIKLATERQRFFGDPKSTDPHSLLMEEISRSAGIVAFYEDKLNELRTLDGMTDEDILTQVTLKDGVKPSVWMELFMTERDHMVRTCIAAIKAGVAERKVQIAEQQGRMIAAMMFAFMHDSELGLSADQIIKAPSIIRRHLLSLPSANPVQVDPQQILDARAVEVP